MLMKSERYSCDPYFMLTDQRQLISMQLGEYPDRDTTCHLCCSLPSCVQSCNKLNYTILFLLGKRRVDRTYKVRVQGQHFTLSTLKRETAMCKKLPLDGYLVNMIDPSHPVRTINMKHILRHLIFCSKSFKYLPSHNPKLCLGFGLYPPVLGSACQKFTNLSWKTVKTRRMSLILSLAQESQAGNL